MVEQKCVLLVAIRKGELNGRFEKDDKDYAAET